MPAGAALYKATGAGFPDTSRKKAEKADAIYLGAMGLPEVRYEDGTEIAPQLDLRSRLDLYAGVRPVRTYLGLPTPLAAPEAQELDFVIIRESTEGLFAERAQGTVADDQVARDALVITRPVCEKLFDFTFSACRTPYRPGQTRPGRLHRQGKCLKLYGFLPGKYSMNVPETSHSKDRAPLCRRNWMELVCQPWIFNVMVTENMFGDIISDLAGGPMGSMGLSPLRRYRRQACGLPTSPRHRAEYCRRRQGKPYRRHSIRRHDVGMARRYP